MKRVSLLCLMAFGLFGCASVPPSDTYLSQMKRSPSASLTSVSLQASDVLTLKQGTNSYHIDSHDKVVQISNYSSYYKIFKIDGAHAGGLKVSLNSYCACFGYDKRIMVPVLYGLSSTGRVIKAGSSKYDLHQASGVATPLHISFDAEFSGADLSYIVVAADNSSIDQPIEHIHILVNNFPSTTLDVLAYPVGRFELEVSAESVSADNKGV
ncbi:hypothetical protein [Dyella sp. Tek66A03]|uniref:hypothetical protein n=1 Tax=Dyella sp. Tek66A03 TaxID=3458298 RepID=UPI00403ECFE7